MLQQTQVATVTAYFLKFMQTFPTLSALAYAHEDQILKLWTGLGYYTRARNILKAAKKIMHEFQGEFPDNFTDLLSLPGIGRSTAGAILSMGFKKPAAILDGNVKRVFTRLHGIKAPIDTTATTNHLWEIAEAYLRSTSPRVYTQALMDMGALICKRANPNCTICPFKTVCIAYQTDGVSDLPRKSKTRKLPTRETNFLIMQNVKGQLLLQRRPAKGIWAGLFSFPEIAHKVSEKEIIGYCEKEFSLVVKNCKPLPSFRHTFTHYHLTIHPYRLTISHPADRRKGKKMAEKQEIWYKPRSLIEVGVPRPVEKLFNDIAQMKPRIVKCAKLKREAEGLTHPPMPGEIGQNIYEQVSKEAWAMWLKHQTMLINEYRLNMMETKSRNFLLREMENFLFGEGSELPPGYVSKD